MSRREDESYIREKEQRRREERQDEIRRQERSQSQPIKTLAELADEAAANEF